MDPTPPTDTSATLRGTRCDDDVPERAIYVACLASYNHGLLFGAWIDAAQDVESIRAQISSMLRRSPHPNVMVPCPECEVASAEEWAIHDHRGFEGVSLSEWHDLAEVAALAEALDAHGEAFARWFDSGVRGQDPDGWADEFREAYQGTFRDLAAYAESVLNDTFDLDKMMGNLAGYIDFERYGRDLELGGDVWTAEGGDGIYVFSNL